MAIVQPAERRLIMFAGWVRAVVTGLLALAFIGSSLLDFVSAAFRRFDPRRP